MHLFAGEQHLPGDAMTLASDGHRNVRHQWIYSSIKDKTLCGLIGLSRCHDQQEIQMVRRAYLGGLTIAIPGKYSKVGLGRHTTGTVAQGAMSDHMAIGSRREKQTHPCRLSRRSIFRQ